MNKFKEYLEQTNASDQSQKDIEKKLQELAVEITKFEQNIRKQSLEFIEEIRKYLYKYKPTPADKELYYKMSGKWDQLKKLENSMPRKAEWEQ